MINKKTALILGAGASWNFGYPLGFGLKNEIISHLDKVMYKVKQIDDKITQLQQSYNNDYSGLITMAMPPQGMLRSHSKIDHKNLTEYLVENCMIEPRVIIDFYNNFKGAHLNTIDTFLEERPEFLELGKILIAYSILLHEDSELLFDSPLEGRNWYNYLLSQVGPKWNDLQNGNLKIVTYNYDRSLEHYFLHSFINTYGKDKQDDYKECIKLVESYQILHVHGCVGRYTWGIGNEAKPYNTTIESINLNKAALEVEVISEVNTNDAYSKVSDILNWAKEIFILGFGFDDRNLERLNLHKYQKPIYASRYGLSDREVREINNKTNNSILFSNNETHDILSFLKNDIGLSGIRAKEYDNYKFPFEIL